VWEFFDYADFG